MKKRMIFLFTAGVALTTVLILSACNKKNSKSNPVSWLDSYSPDYTEKAGTSHQGDFFPVVPGKLCFYMAQMTMDMRIKVTGAYKLDTTMTIPSNGIIQTQILPSIDSDLGGKTYTLFPERSTSNLGGVTSSEITRYYEIGDSVVYIRAIPDPDGTGLTEVENPVFMKNNLIVGDNWLSEPTVDVSKYSRNAGAEITDISAKCRMFVVGLDSAEFPYAIPIPWRHQVRLDEIVQFSGSGVVEEDVKITMSGKVVVNLYLVDGVGIVADKEDIEVTAKASEGSTKMEITISVTGGVLISPVVGPLPLITKARAEGKYGNLPPGLSARLDSTIEMMMTVVDGFSIR